MKTLDEFNEEQRACYDDNKQVDRPNGIECPDCSYELRDIDPSLIFTSNPPQTAVYCQACGWDGKRIA